MVEGIMMVVVLEIVRLMEKSDIEVIAMKTTTIKTTSTASAKTTTGNGNGSGTDNGSDDFN